MKWPVPKFNRKTLTILAVGLVFFSLLLFGAQFLVNTGVSRAWIARKIESAVDAEVAFGSVSVSLLPVPSITLEEPRYTSGTTVVARAEKLKVYPSIWSFLNGKVGLHKIVLASPRILLELRPDAGPSGLGAWPDVLRSFSAGLQGRAKDLYGTSLEVVAGQLVFANAGLSRFNLASIDIEAGLSADGALEVKLEAASGFAGQIRLQFTMDAQGPGIHLRARFEGLDLQAAAALKALEKVDLPRGRIDLALEAESSAAEDISARIVVSSGDLIFGRGKESFNAGDLKSVAAVNWTRRKLEVRLENLRFSRPALEVSGALDWMMTPRVPRIRLAVRAGSFSIGHLRRALSAAVGPGFLNDKLFRIVRRGRVYGLELESRASSWHDLFAPGKLHLSARLSGGSLVIPQLGWELKNVSGKVVLKDGVLEGRHLAAAMGKTTATDGVLRLGLAGRDVFYVGCGFEADLARLPGLVRRFSTKPEVLAELERIASIKGTAKGRLVVQKGDEAWQVQVRAGQVHLEADYDRLPEKVVIRGGKLVFSGHRLELARMEGSIGSSIFKGLGGSLDWSGPLELELRPAGLRLDAGQLYAWAEPLLGKSTAGFDLADIGGWAEVTYLRLKKSPHAPSGWQIEAGVSLDQLLVDAGVLPACVVIRQADLDLDSDHLVFSNLEMTMGGTTLRAGGVVEGIFSSSPRLQLSLDGRVGRTTRDWLFETFGVNPRLRAGGTISIAKLELAAGQGRLEVEADAEFVPGLTLSLAMGIRQSELDIRRLFLEDQNSRASLALAHFFGSGRWQVDFSGNLSAATLAKLWNLPPQTAGQISGKVQLDLDLEAVGVSSLAGRLEIERLNLPFGFLKGIRIEHATVDGRSGRVAVSKARVNLNGQDLSIRGRLDLKPDSIYMDMSAGAAVMDVAKIQDLLGSKRPAESRGASKSGIFPPLRGVVALNFERLEFGDYAGQPFNAVAILDGEKVSIRLVDVKVCGITVAGAIRFGPQGVAFDLVPSLEETRLKYTVGCLAGADTSEKIEGSLAVSGHLAGKGRSRRQLLDNLQGSLVVNMADGRLFNIGRAGLFTNIIAYLKINKLVTGDLPDLRRRDLPFKSISARMVFKGGKILLEDARIKARMLNVVCEGEMDLTGQTMNLTALVSPLTSVDWIVSHTPVVGKVLKGTLVAIPVSVRGPLNDPAVVPLAPQAVGTRILGILKRTFKAPFELIQPILPKTPPASGVQPEEEEDGYGH